MGSSGIRNGRNARNERNARNARNARNEPSNTKRNETQLKNASLNGKKVDIKNKKKRKETRAMFKKLELKRLKKQFDVIDADNSGELDTKELFVLFAALGCKVTKRQIESLVKDIDQDSSGDLDFDEFLLLYNKIKNSKTGFLATAKKNVNKMSEKLQAHVKEQEKLENGNCYMPIKQH